MINKSDLVFRHYMYCTLMNDLCEACSLNYGIIVWKLIEISW